MGTIILPFHTPSLESLRMDDTAGVLPTLESTVAAMYELMETKWLMAAMHPWLRACLMLCILVPMQWFMAAMQRTL